MKPFTCSSALDPSGASECASGTEPVNATATAPQPQATTETETSSAPPAALPAASSLTQEVTKRTNDPHNQDDALTIIHFNDCYNVESGPKSSGAAGFLSAVEEHRALEPLILFSGDILSPSFMSTFTKGEQMIPVLNDIRVDCAVFGNHEFDYGVDNLIEFVKRTTFPWLLSNVIDKETSNQLGDGQVFHVIEKGGFKFGLVGLIEEEWLSTLSTLDPSDVIYQDFVARGRELARWLKGEPHQVDYVIALTHFRRPNDIRLADSVPEIDLILGGHDHDYEVIRRPNCYIIKSGTDFREFSRITLRVNPEYRRNSGGGGGGSPFLEPLIERVDCSRYPPHPELDAKLKKFSKTIDEKMSKVLGQFNCELDGRFSSIRKSETNLGNFVTDIMLASTHADLAILNSGTLRSDRIHPKGDFTMRDLFNILGYIDPIAVLNATGHHIWRALENGVSQWPKLEGRFPQISGCSFTFDPSQPPGQRIRPEDILIGDEPLVLDKSYRLTTKEYLASGKDGYDMLKECDTVVAGDECPDLTTSILNHFEAINIVKSKRRTHHRQSIICLSRSCLKKILETSSSDSPNALANHFADRSPSPTSNQHHHQHQPHHNHSLLSDYGERERSLSPGKVDTVEEEEEEVAAAAAAVAPPAAVVVGDDNNNLRHENLIGEGAPAASPAAPKTSSPLPTSPQTTRRNSLECEPITPILNRHNAHQPKRIMSLNEIETEQCKLEPKVEGRIKIVGSPE